MTKSKVLEIIDRRIAEQYKIIREYERGSAYHRAQAVKEQLIDLRIEIEKIGTNAEGGGKSAH